MYNSTRHLPIRVSGPIYIYIVFLKILFFLEFRLRFDFRQKRTKIEGFEPWDRQKSSSPRSDDLFALVKTEN